MNQTTHENKLNGLDDNDKAQKTKNIIVDPFFGCLFVVWCAEMNELYSKHVAPKEKGKIEKNYNFNAEMTSNDRLLCYLYANFVLGDGPKENGN